MACMDNSAAAAYAGFGSGRSPAVTTSARRIEEFEISWGRALAALHVATRNDPVADAHDRYNLQPSARDPHIGSRLRIRFCWAAAAECCATDVGAIARGDGSDA